MGSEAALQLSLNLHLRGHCRACPLWHLPPPHGKLQPLLLQCSLPAGTKQGSGDAQSGNMRGPGPFSAEGEADAGP